MIISFRTFDEVNANGVIILFYRGAHIAANMISANKDVATKVGFAWSIAWIFLADSITIRWADLQLAEW